MALIAPSLLSADFTDLKSEVKMLNNSHADWLHLDVMDGVFVPNISFGMPVIKAIKPLTSKPLDVHLMIVNPDRFIDDFKAAGADWLTVHFEACTHLHRTIQAIKLAGMKAGVSLNPHTPVSMLSEVIDQLDLVLIMSVNPGFGGQKFITNTLNKVTELRALIRSKNSRALIEIDGGVNLVTGEALIKNGADVLVAGSFVFKSNDPTQTINALKNL